MPCSFLNSEMIQSMTRWSMLSPPRWVSPLVDFTSTTPSPTSRIGDIERTAAEVIDGDGFVLFLVETVGQGRRRRLIDDALYVETRDLAGVFGGLALRVVEVGRNGDHGFGHLLAQVGFRGFLQLGQNHRRDFRRRILFALNIDAGVAVFAPYHFVRDHLLLFRDFV